jgi:hypothetical protein
MDHRVRRHLAWLASVKVANSSPKSGERYSACPHGQKVCMLELDSGRDYTSMLFVPQTSGVTLPKQHQTSINSLYILPLTCLHSKPGSKQNQIFTIYAFGAVQSAFMLQTLQNQNLVFTIDIS